MIRSAVSRVPRTLGPRGLPSSYPTWQRLIASNGVIGCNNDSALTTGVETWGRRPFSSKAGADGDESGEGGDKNEEGAEGGEGNGKGGQEEGASGNEGEGEGEGEEEISEAAKEAAKFKEEAANLKDQLLRALAEQENIRGIAKRDIEKERSFAVTKMAKSLLDVSDNLERALEAVPEDVRDDKEGNPVLASLYEGISMTESLLHKSFASNGLEKFGTPGDPFDPNLHEAMFEYPDENFEKGQIGQVMKKGFRLNGRVIRSCQVGVVKK